VRGGGIVDVRVIRCGLLFRNIPNVDVGQVVVFVMSQNVGKKSVFFAGCWVRAPFENDILNFTCFIAALAFVKGVERILSYADSSVCLMLIGMVIGGINTMRFVLLFVVFTVYDC